ncbi:ThiF family adenylyltransferase [Mangrovihabitans endophyticus]|nr:ThiF family adenylyltransferase [Mangrovihabitans endophyticus]
MLRPLLLPGLPRLWRGPHTLQLGLDPDRAVLFDLPHARVAQILDLMDGTRPERAVYAYGTSLGVAPDDVRVLVDALRAAGYLLSAPSLMPATLADDHRGRLLAEAAAVALSAPAPLAGTPRPPAPTRRSPSPAQVLRRRLAACVIVAGAGRLGPPIAVALAQSGIGHVHPQLSGTVSPADLAGGPLHADDIGQPAVAATTAALQRAAPDTRTGPVRRGTASLVVQLGFDQPVELLAARFAARRQPHLRVGLREATAIVGPLVPAAGRPCLNCLDLHRSDRDPQWPQLVRQAQPRVAEPCSVTTVLAATAYACAEVLAYLDGAAAQTVGAAVEIRGPGRVRRRAWPPHPACMCHRPTGLSPRKSPEGNDTGR